MERIAKGNDNSRCLESRPIEVRGARMFFNILAPFWETTVPSTAALQPQQFHILEVQT